MGIGTVNWDGALRSRTAVRNEVAKRYIGTRRIPSLLPCSVLVPYDSFAVWCILHMFGIRAWQLCGACIRFSESRRSHSVSLSFGY